MCDVYDVLVKVCKAWMYCDSMSTNRPPEFDSSSFRTSNGEPLVSLIWIAVVLIPTKTLSTRRAKDRPVLTDNSQNMENDICQWSSPSVLALLLHRITFVISYTYWRLELYGKPEMYGHFLPIELSHSFRSFFHLFQ